ncbi:MAG TPA: HAMP domain-containing sensor histidine kinase [Candidatus Limnocylindrales bacterium]|nr:HAMP domain-containing sensor histidine kinase [Candidatus Limnocylindrales bacterium]
MERPAVTRSAVAAERDPAAFRSGEAGGTFLELAIDALPIGVMVCIPDGDRPNDAFRRIWGFGPGRPMDRRAVERSLRPIATHRSRPWRAAGAATPRPIATALSGVEWPPQRVAILRADGSSGVVRLAAHPMRGRDGVGAVVSAIDETGQVELERLRDGFLNIVGHELRSPISSILGAAELMDDPGLPPEVRADLRTDLVSEARRLDELVGQMVRLADLQPLGDVLTDEPTHLGHLARERVARWRQRRPRLAIEVDAPVDPPPLVAGESGYVAQVIDAILDNAAKYAGSGRITVRIEHGAGDVRLHVLDEGPGFPAVPPEAIFGLFQRGVARGHELVAPAGNGIGLFVARSIVEALSGRIWAANRADGGADVGFSLPVAKG